MFRCISVVLAATGLAVAASQSTYPTEIPGVHLQADPGVCGPALQIVHLYYDQFPTGFAMSSTGRMFSTYPASLYEKNQYNYTLAELCSSTEEFAYPNAAINAPPSGRVNSSTTPPSTVNYRDYLISVQGLIIDAQDRLWLLDNGRVISDGMLLSASYGGPKLVGVNLTTNEVFKTIVFPTNVAYGDSYLNDLRCDFRANITASGGGVCYITDSSSSGQTGIIVVDIGTGNSWRHLTGDARTKPTQQHFLSVWGDPIYYLTGPGLPYQYDSTGADGLALSADGSTLFWSVTGSRRLFSIPTARLLDRSSSSEVLAQSAVHDLGEKGVSDGIESDSNNLVYVSNFEQNGLNVYNPANASVSTLVRDPRIGWTDAIVAGSDGFLYFTENQLWRTPSYYPDGGDRTVKPFVLFRIPIPGNGTAVQLR